MPHAVINRLSPAGSTLSRIRIATRLATASTAFAAVTVRMDSLSSAPLRGWNSDSDAKLMYRLSAGSIATLASATPPPEPSPELPEPISLPVLIPLPPVLPIPIPPLSGLPIPYPPAVADAFCVNTPALRLANCPMRINSTSRTTVWKFSRASPFAFLMIFMIPDNSHMSSCV